MDNQLKIPFANAEVIDDMDETFVNKQNKLPLQVHFTDGTTSYFVLPQKTVDAIVWNGHLLGILLYTGNWWEAEKFCQEHLINNRPCRMMTKGELECLTKEEVDKINKVFRAINKAPLFGSLWGSDSYPGSGSGELATIKEIGNDKPATWTYKKAKNFFKVLPIQ